MLDLNTILMHACSNPDTNFDPSKTLEENKAAADGWDVYNIETHCVGFRIAARYNGDGTFEIRDYTLYNC